VAGTDDVVLGLRTAREAAEAAVLTDGAEAVAPAGEQLVRIALVAHVPDDLVARAVEHAVQRHRQLDRAQAGGQVAAHLTDAREDGLPDLTGEKRQFRLGELLEVGGVGDLIEIAHRHPSIAPGSAARPRPASAPPAANVRGHRAQIGGVARKRVQADESALVGLGREPLGDRDAEA